MDAKNGLGKRINHILLVEDNEDHSELIRRAFAPHFESFVLTTKTSIRGAKNFISSDRPDLMILDYRLEDGHGKDLWAEDLPFPFIVLTSHGDEEKAVESMKRGARDYIVKSGDAFAELPAISEKIISEWNKQVKQKAVAKEIQLERDHYKELSAKNAQKLNEARSNSFLTGLRLETALGAITEGIIITNQHNQVFLVNKVFEKFLDKKMPVLTGLQIEEVINVKAICNQIHGALHSGELKSNFDINWPGLSKKRHYRCVSVPVLDEHGKGHGVVTTFIDLTDQWELSKLKSNFIATAAHEIRTPLTIITGYAELLIKNDLTDGMTPAEIKDCLGYIRDEGNDLSQLVGNLLDASKTEYGSHIKLNKGETDIKSLFHSVSCLLKKQNAETEFELDCEDQLHNWVLDKSRIKQVIFNLYSNAIKYSSGKALIRTSLKKMDGQLSITVQDNGIGMTQEALDHAFDPFFRACDSGSVTGMGLGLHIVQAIISSHSGKIKLESEVGVGTKIHITLPSA